LLKEKLGNYADYLNIVYSSAHIDDLQRSSDPSKTREDLATIKKYSEDQCLAKYWGVENFSYDIRDPFEFFETSIDTKVDYNNIFKSADEKLKESGISNTFKDLFKVAASALLLMLTII